jgi:ABC-type antimicrobial peptide transport system permease subunit
MIISLPFAFKRLKNQTGLFAFANKDFMRGPRKYVMAVIGVAIQSAVTSMSVFQSEVLKQEILAVLDPKYAPIIEPYTILLIIITIVIGSFLVINSIVSSLLERIREFGIMKAVGFNAAFIFKLTVLSSAIIGVMGGLIGCSLGVLFAFMPYLSFRTNLPIPYPIDLHLFYIAISIPVGVITGRLFSRRWTVALLCGSIAASLTYLIPLAFIFYASTVSITNILNKTLSYYLLLLALSISLSIISSLVPAFWISNVKPVEAIRKTV